MPTKVILDVDTGTDDAVALMVAALSPDLELIGATSVNGNTTIDFTTEKFHYPEGYFLMDQQGILPPQEYPVMPPFTPAGALWM